MAKINNKNKGQKQYDSRNYKRGKQRQNIWDKPKQSEIKIIEEPIIM